MDDRSLISIDLMSAVMRDCIDLHQAGDRLFEGEDDFRAAIQAQFLAIAGRLVLSGASAELTREIAAEIDHLVIFGASTMKAAYRKLLDELLPEVDVVSTDPVAAVSDSNNPAKLQQEGNCDETGNA